jgi:hypothetical protein
MMVWFFLRIFTDVISASGGLISGGGDYLLLIPSTNSPSGVSKLSLGGPCLLFLPL